jgi:hypothetical protein
MKVCGFAQLHNEHLNGNLKNWLRCMEVCDEIYVYDQASDDGSFSLYQEVANIHVIPSAVNDFANELACKRTLLEYMLEKSPDTDVIFWMDGDTLLDGRLLVGDTFKCLCDGLIASHYDHVEFTHYNLWRSDTYYRTDNSYHGLRVYPLWKNTGHLEFPAVAGLHKPQIPRGLCRRLPCEFALIHRGFATDDQIIRRYDRYKALGQSGWALERLLDEDGLTVEPLKSELWPHFAPIWDQSTPEWKESIRSIYNAQH